MSFYGVSNDEFFQKQAQKRIAGYGLTEEDASTLGIEVLNPSETARRKLFSGAAIPALRIPYWEPLTGEEMDDGKGHTYFRARRMDDRPDLGKYYQRSGTVPRVYFPRLGIDWGKIIADAKIPLIITEGEFKAAKACKEGFNTIALGGVDSVSSGKRGIAFLPDLDQFYWTERPVAIIYDSDLDTNSRVQNALQKLANEVLKRGGKPSKVLLPKGNKKVGLDDYLIAEGRDNLQVLIDAAEPISFGWRTLYTTGPTGPHKHVANVLIALENAPELEGKFRYDKMSWQVSTPTGLLQDEDVVQLQKWLQAEGGLPTIGNKITYEGIALHARDNGYDPLQELLEAQVWDGAARLDHWLVSYLGVEDGPYTRLVGVKFLLGLVDRALHPGCKMDYVLMLYDPQQGTLKSTACEVLAIRPEWFTDQLPDIASRDKDLSQNLVGKLVVELPELHALRAKDVEAQKSFFSRREEKYRPSYGRADVIRPRRNVFIGTTNQREMLHDVTGNRRYWPVTTGRIEIDALRRDMLQIYAEAIVRLKGGELPYPDEEQRALIAAVGRDYVVEEPLAEIIGKWLKEHQDRTTDGYFFFEFSGNRPKFAGTMPDHMPLTSTAIMIHALGMDAERIGRGSNRVGMAMAQLGYSKLKSHGNLVWKRARG